MLDSSSHPSVLMRERLLNINNSRPSVRSKSYLYFYRSGYSLPYMVKYIH